jgi:hypothetical protein
MRRNLQLAQEDNTSVKEALSQEGKERNIAQQRVEEMDRQISGVFQAILDSTKLKEASSEEKRRKIIEDLVQYKEQIKELEEHMQYLGLPQHFERKERKT